jgi:hypothetical protein
MCITENGIRQKRVVSTILERANLVVFENGDTITFEQLENLTIEIVEVVKSVKSIWERIKTLFKSIWS